MGTGNEKRTHSLLITFAESRTGAINPAFLLKWAYYFSSFHLVEAEPAVTIRKGAIPKRTRRHNILTGYSTDTAGLKSAGFQSEMISVVSRGDRCSM